MVVVVGCRRSRVPVSRCSGVVVELVLRHVGIVVGRGHRRLVEMVGGLRPVRGRLGLQLGVVAQVQRGRDLGDAVGGQLGEVVYGQLRVVCKVMGGMRYSKGKGVVD